ncbi:DUF397 domain-containing protein [Streptomyces alkaliphilus]|uniref:DUF397 domain-containing protein n=1 Tax=Streptomyces alkaliphilus TaxID=1472722 RepID=A0A7W3TBS3_9ACTN|nr:DUF397 domain-containing protein [Streptomyces alkaliphilus]MBB0243770.1 DUF397 domain-containing protein [Streptomyces alkaliphilus]
MIFPTWQKSSFSTNGAECLEMRHSSTFIQLRESESPENILAADPKRVHALIHHLKNSAGEQE